MLEEHIVRSNQAVDFRMPRVYQSYNFLFLFYMQKCFVLENIAWQVRCSINIMQQVPSIFGDKTLESVRNTLFKFH